MTGAIRKIAQWVLLVLAGVFLVIQFIRPAWNSSDEPPINTIIFAFPVPDEVQTLLRRSCFDCHSNNTVYPWYAQVQPVGWWLQSHVDEGRGELNFDEFGTYRPMRQFTKLQQIAEQIEEDEMPLPSYLFIHRDARLAAEEKTILTDWVTAMRDSMRVWYPADSLQRPRRQPQ